MSVFDLSFWARRGEVGLGSVRSGTVRCAGEGRGLVCPGLVRYGMAWLGLVGCGETRQGRAC